MTESKTYTYKDKEITFQLTQKEEVMINATQMIKAFPNKRISDYLNKSTTEELVRVLFIRKHSLIGREVENYLSMSVRELANIDKSILRIVKGGLGEQGTWMCEDLILDFAQWLSRDFKLWCNDRIRELLNGRNDGYKIRGGFGKRKYSSSLYTNYLQR